MQISKNEDKVNAHAGMPFCGISRFVVLAFGAGYRQQPFWGVGRLRLSFLGMHSLTWINASTYAFFVSSQNLAKFLQNGADSKGVNDGAFNGF